MHEDLILFKFLGGPMDGELRLESKHLQEYCSYWPTELPYPVLYAEHRYHSQGTTFIYQGRTPICTSTNQ